MERYPLLELAAHLRLVLTAAAEGWDLSTIPPPAEDEGEIVAVVQPYGQGPREQE